MNGVNRVIIVGTLGADPKTQTSREGKPYAHLSLATNRRWRNKEGQLERRTDWHRVTVWGRLAEICQEFLRKGSNVCVEGYLSTFEFNDADGGKRWFTSISAEEIDFLPSSRKTEKPTESIGDDV